MVSYFAHGCLLMWYSSSLVAKLTIDSRLHIFFVSTIAVLSVMPIINPTKIDSESICFFFGLLRAAYTAVYCVYGIVIE